MGRASTITALPEDVRRWLERALTERGFSGYEELEALLRDKGYTVGKSSIHRHGQKLERHMARIKAANDAAMLIADAAGDHADNRSAAVLAMIQEQTFNTMLNLAEADESDDPSEKLKLMNTAMRGVADMTRASIALKKHQRETAERLKAMENDARTGKRTLDAETLRIVREEIYGA